ncbi:hypothetical protein [Bacillus sp. SM2101]|uniref:hypothetical protein n=1 Tax=Bacillus sp. SM2101 TaxID=2805366 RepID=UPI001BDF30A0|nr:hypothetical protein [Bacillus sp. SM2101]
MSKGLIGKILILLGWIIIGIKAVYYQEELFRYIFIGAAIVMFIMGSILIPTYSNKNEDI